MFINEAEEYFKDRDVAHEVCADIWMEDTINAIKAVTDAFHRGYTLKDMSEIVQKMDEYIAKLSKAPQSERVQGAKEAFVIAKKLVEDGIQTKIVRENAE